MKEKHLLIGVLATVLFGASVVQSAAQRLCIGPFKPVVEQFVETGKQGDLRQEFELYFDEVATYLDCLNAESYRVHNEATQAAREYDSVLDKFPPNNRDLLEVPPRPPMVSSGHLNLNYKGSGG